VIQNQRVIHSTTDISALVNDFRSGFHLFPYQTGEYLYIGSVLPMNNLWFDMKVPSVVNGAVPTVEIWWANAWHSAVDLIDETDGLKKTGRIQWNTDRFKSWDFEQTSEDVQGVQSFKIYWKYWLRVSWSANLSVTTEIKYVGQRYSSDTVLYSFYPDLRAPALMSAFETGKTNWNEQHYMAAEHIERDLKKRGIIKDRAQIMDWHMLQDASCHKVAEIVYTSFGEPYADQLARARKDYNEAVNLKHYNLDVSGNGSLEPIERKFSTDFMTR